MADDLFSNLVKGLTKILAINQVDPEVDLVNVSSEAIDYIEYDYVAQILQVTFNSGSTYGYSGVSEDQVDSLINASSVGRTFVQEIRNNYIYWRIS